MPVTDPRALIENRKAAIREFQDAVGQDRAQIDVSGGIDSAVMAGLLSRALGPKKITPVFTGIHSSGDSRHRAIKTCEAFGLKLVMDDLSLEFENRLDRMLTNLTRAGFSRAELDQRMKNDPTILGSIRSTMRAPVGRAYNRLSGGGIRYGTGNECEDRFLRFYQKGGDGEVDCNPLAMLSKGEVFQLGFALGVPKEVLNATPSPDLWGNGDGHSDEQELRKLTGVDWAYSRVSDGEYTSVGSIEQVSRWLDSVQDQLFADDRAIELIVGGRWLVPPFGHPAFTGLAADCVIDLLTSAKLIERATRHKMNPNCPTLGTREILIDTGIITNQLPVLTRQET
ncbi:MAG: hypothetical protein L3J82_05975 [Planctomycetes bacterium]|nr:hypothetical protein [Planctomycetota bacterium]